MLGTRRFPCRTVCGPLKQAYKQKVASGSDNLLIAVCALTLSKYSVFVEYAKMAFLFPWDFHFDRPGGAHSDTRGLSE
jgi:hypothetical protein